MNFKEKTYLLSMRVAMAMAGVSVPGFAKAQEAEGDAKAAGGATVITGMTDAICGLIGPLVGKSKMLSLIFLIALGVMLFLWWMSENKEGVMVWLMRTGLAIAVLINLFTVPSLIGLPNPC